MISLYNVKHSSFISLSFLKVIFQYIGCICPILARVQKFFRSRNWSLAIATIHEESFPLLHYYGISNHISVASEAQTNECPTGKDRNYRTIKLQDYRTKASDCLSHPLLHVTPTKCHHYQKTKCLINIKLTG
jgi:hypothetical protein